MSDPDFDTALVTAAFRLAGDQGWRGLNVAKAARAAGLSVAEARGRFPSRSAILMRFGRLADQTALLDAPDDGPVRDRLFDLLMRRFDVLQTHRAGIKALLRFLPTDPPTALLLACATRRSMRWMLQGAGITATGANGALQERGLLAIWLWAVRAWERDESEDLSGTMAAVDSALQRADRLASWLHVRQSAPPPPPMSDGAGELDPAHPPPPDPRPPDPTPFDPKPPDRSPFDPPPFDPPPPAGPRPSATPSSGTPSSATLPSGASPSGTPPATRPPAATPPTATPPSGTPPATRPPAAIPLTTTPPTTTSPTTIPPATSPPGGPPPGARTQAPTPPAPTPSAHPPTSDTRPLDDPLA